MEFVWQATARPSRLGVLPGTFNPVTVAHVALAEAALQCCDEVLFVLPRVFPHKTYSGASFEQRLELLNRALRSNEKVSLAVAEAGLFVDIADECREVYGRQVRLSFLCGRDAAERIASWDYGSPDAFSSMLCKFYILVACRNGEYTAPPECSGGIQRLELANGYDHVSATEVRERLAQGTPWEHLVPAEIQRSVDSGSRAQRAGREECVDATL